MKQPETEREFLTLDEINLLVRTECDLPMMKTACLFSALTGLRWSDIERLTWSQVQSDPQVGHYLRFRQKKTGGFETLPVSDQAIQILGQSGTPDELVFGGLKYSCPLPLSRNYSTLDWLRLRGSGQLPICHAR